MWSNVDFDKLGKLLLPLKLRQPKLMALVKGYLQPMITLHYNWTQFRNKKLYELEHTGQVCFLRGALNDAFDVDLRRIYIDGTGGDALKTYIYTPGEEQPEYLGKLWLRNSLEFEDDGADFLVYVPIAIANALNYELRALIDFYKVASKRYLIIPINE